jgi:RimJ/RimL family protein N-acetyltransferase
MFTVRKIVFLGNQWYVSPLNAADETDLQDLLLRASDYTELLTGEPVGSDDAAELLVDTPPGKSPEDKWIFGIYPVGDSKLIGVIDMVADHPVNGTWFLGLMLLDPEYRGSGFGEEIVNSLFAWLAERDVHGVRIGVVEHNQGALRFWKRMGFCEIDRRPPMLFGQRESAVFVMEREL